ncbi:tRNA (adenosine(37)-N6)-threonylcarbamoyltransferase complex ATPase subunit type 1 TsaE, partial [Leptospira santarosai]|nr:tRNA (adenosine(37)-N6)-threonylcarbamoyltransferase complex ATPase subunit type 1 TsaE [Leptospira santarosai]
MTYIKRVTSLEETEQFGQRLGSLVEAQDVITLEGDLGAGKTTFTKSF